MEQGKCRLILMLAGRSILLHHPLSIHIFEPQMDIAGSLYCRVLVGQEQYIVQTLARDMFASRLFWTRQAFIFP